jgi:hypothetical protein
MAKELGMIENSDKGRKAIEYHANEAKKRQQEHGGTAPGRSKTLVEPVPQVLKPATRPARRSGCRDGRILAKFSQN